MSTTAGYLPPPDPEVPCCWAALNGDACTCWGPVLDAVPQPPQEGPCAVQPRLCGDCAYRKGSPEREADEGYAPSYGPSDPFFCHQNVPRAVAYTHPVGITVTAPDPGDYQPIVDGGRAYQSSGAPAVLCAGWAAANGYPRGPRR